MLELLEVGLEDVELTVLVETVLTVLEVAELDTFEVELELLEDETDVELEELEMDVETELELLEVEADDETELELLDLEEVVEVKLEEVEDDVVEVIGRLVVTEDEVVVTPVPLLIARSWNGRASVELAKVAARRANEKRMIIVVDEKVEQER